MSTNIMQKILSLENLIITQQKNHADPSNLEQFNQLIQHMKGVGLIEGMGPGHKEERYFLFEGSSWQKICQELKKTITPNFIMWEEKEFFIFLEKLVKNPEELKAISLFKK